MGLISWVTCQNFLSEHVTVNFSVYFGGGNLLMSEHHLDGTKVGSSLKKMGGKGVAEGVRTDLFLYACFGTISLDDIEDHDAAELSAKTIEKDEILEAMLDVEFVAEGIVVAYFLKG